MDAPCLMGQTNARSKWHRVVQSATERDRAACNGLRPQEPYHAMPGSTDLAIRLIAKRRGFDLCLRCWPVTGRVTPQIAEEVAAADFHGGVGMPATYFELNPGVNVVELTALAEYLQISDEEAWVAYLAWNRARDMKENP